MPAEVILASSSKYRAALLSIIHINARCISPNIDEAPLSQEQPKETAARLALTKARTIAKTHPECIIIGSDQVACINGNALGKPGTKTNARAQLKAQSGNNVLFYTAVCVMYGDSFMSDTIVTDVLFRRLTEVEINTYIDLENPIDCAGSFKSEGLGCTLFKHIKSNDPTALVGLPLIRTAEFLRRFGVNPLVPPASGYSQ